MKTISFIFLLSTCFALTGCNASDVVGLLVLGGLYILYLIIRESWSSSDVSGLLKKESMGVPLKYKCAICGKRLHGGTGGAVIGGSEVMEHFRRKALYCDVCKKTYCTQCSYLAASTKGMRGFICPLCGGAVSYIPQER